jgi:hypothetical protein
MLVIQENLKAEIMTRGKNLGFQLVQMFLHLTNRHMKRIDLTPSRTHIVK